MKFFFDFIFAYARARAMSKGSCHCKENSDIQEIGEVEVEDGVNKANVAKWRLMSETAGMGRVTKKFFLYVPEGAEEKAEWLLEDNGIAYAGLRTWDVKGGSLVITPIKTPDSPKDHR